VARELVIRLGIVLTDQVAACLVNNHRHLLLIAE
jgi:hypothetical protein